MLNNICEIIAPKKYNLKIIEFPENNKYKAFKYSKELSCLVYKDSETTICPMKSADSVGRECYSFFVIPNKARPKFL